MSTRTRQAQAAARTKGNAPRPSAAGRAGNTLVRGLRAVHRRHLGYAAGGCAAVAAVCVGLAVFGDGDDRPPVPDTRARHYTETDACLLTGESGITTGTHGATVWAGMQDASLKTHARVSYTPVTGEQSAAAATPFLNGMLQRSCEVVVATGKAELA
ncbi:MAG: BMP family ABC transporter substrate-binding protein, partial [Streptomyces sp.]|nr:BMP family ABC transporter substrate-binding protein [Streptomyces sp.]